MNKKANLPAMLILSLLIPSSFAFGAGPLCHKLFPGENAEANKALSAIMTSVSKTAKMLGQIKNESGLNKAYNSKEALRLEDLESPKARHPFANKDDVDSSTAPLWNSISPGLFSKDFKPHVAASWTRLISTDAVFENFNQVVDFWTTIPDGLVNSPLAGMHSISSGKQDLLTIVQKKLRNASAAQKAKLEQALIEKLIQISDDIITESKQIPSEHVQFVNDAFDSFEQLIKAIKHLKYPSEAIVFELTEIRKELKQELSKIDSQGAEGNSMIREKIRSSWFLLEDAIIATSASLDIKSVSLQNYIFANRNYFTRSTTILLPTKSKLIPEINKSLLEIMQNDNNIFDSLKVATHFVETGEFKEQVLQFLRMSATTRGLHPQLVGQVQLLLSRAEKP